MKLLPYQQALVDDQTQLKIVVHDRCVGATTAAIHRAVKLELTKPQGTYYLAFAVHEVVRLCLERAKTLGIRTRSRVRADGNEEIRFFNGGYVVVLKHNKTTHCRIGSLCRLVIDSAAYTPNFASLYIVASSCSDVLLVSDYRDEESDKPNPFNSIVRKIYDMSDCQRQDISLHVIDMNTALQDGLYQGICKENGQVWSAEAESRWLERRSLVEEPSLLKCLENHRLISSGT